MNSHAPEAQPSKEVFVLSERSTTVFNDLDLVLTAGVPTLIPETLLARVLSQPGVVQVHLQKED